MSWRTLSHDQLISLYPFPNVPNRYFRSTRWRRLGTISSPVPSSYRASPLCSSTNKCWTTQVFQIIWDDSFPQDPLFIVRPAYEMGRRFYVGKNNRHKAGTFAAGHVRDACWHGTNPAMQNDKGGDGQTVRPGSGDVLGVVWRTST